MLIGYVIDYDTRDHGKAVDYVTFEYFQDLDNSVAATYTDQDVHGRSEPHLFYGNTGPDTYNFEIKLVASVNEADGGTTKSIYDSYLFLKSFQFPDYGEGNYGPPLPPHQVIISIGKLFRKRGVIQSPSFTLHSPYDEDGYPHSITARFTFRVVNPTPLSYRNVRSLIGIRGL